MLSLAKTLPLLAFAVCLQAGAEVPTDVLRNEIYRFSLESPAKNWRLLDAEAIKPIVPDAAAGMQGPGGLFGAIIVEQVGDAELEAYAQLLVDGMPVEELNVVSFERIERRGQTGHQTHFTCSINGANFRFLRTIYFKSGWAYQIVGWGLGSSASAKNLAVISDAFSFLPGKVRRVATTAVTPDATGLGWIIRDGVFRTVTSGVEVAPPKDWKMLTGPQLFAMNEDAFIGLQRSGTEQYLILISENTNEENSAALIDIYWDDFYTGLGGAPKGEPQAASLLGQEFTLNNALVEDGLNLRMLQGAVFVNGRAYQVLGWWLESPKETQERLDALQAALNGIRLLMDEELANLKQELRRAPDQQNSVGPGFSLRRGIYRDFQNAFTWTSPKGYWRMQAGADARRSNEDASLMIEDLETGIYAAIIAESSDGWTQEDYHDVVVSMTLPAGIDSGPEELKLQGGQGLISTGINDDVGIDLTYQIVTSIQGPTALQLLIWGEPQVMERETERIAAAIKGLAHVKPPFRAIRVNMSGFEDLRMGYRLSLPDRGWKRKDETPTDLKGLGSVMSWTRRGVNVTTSTVCGLLDDSSEEAMVNALITSLPIAISPGSPKQPKRSKTTLGGLPATHLSWPGSSTIEVAVIVRDRSLYALIFSPSKARNSLTFEEACACFGCLD